MKRIVAVLSLFLMLQSMQAQRKKFDHILTTTDIALIEDFLRTAHPEDPRRIVLKPRLRSLKNMAWTKSGTMNYADRKPVEAPVKTAPQNAMLAAKKEENEFRALLEDSKTKREEIASEVLNQIFNNDEKSGESVLMIRNDSDCNMIMQIQGNDHYKLAIPAHEENSILVKQGDYLLETNVCEAKYQSEKKIVGMILVSLSNPLRTTGILKNKEQATLPSVPAAAALVH